jgi:hypothetical protein
VIAGVVASILWAGKPIGADQGAVEDARPAGTVALQPHQAAGQADRVRQCGRARPRVQAHELLQVVADAGGVVHVHQGTSDAVHGLAQHRDREIRPAAGDQATTLLGHLTVSLRVLPPPPIRITPAVPAQPVHQRGQLVTSDPPISADRGAGAGGPVPHRVGHCRRLPRPDGWRGQLRRSGVPTSHGHRLDPRRSPEPPRFRSVLVPTATREGLGPPDGDSPSAGIGGHRSIPGRTRLGPGRVQWPRSR